MKSANYQQMINIVVVNIEKIMVSMVGLAGLEPATDRLWVERSNQLSYRPFEKGANDTYKLTLAQDFDLKE